MDKNSNSQGSQNKNAGSNTQNRNTGSTGHTSSTGINDPFKTSGKTEKITHKVGDTIEKVGDFVGSKISKKAGEAIRNVGDKIEHSQD